MLADFQVYISVPLRTMSVEQIHLQFYLKSLLVKYSIFILLIESRIYTFLKMKRVMHNSCQSNVAFVLMIEIRI